MHFMSPSEYLIYGQADETVGTSIYVVAGYSGLGWDWPPTLAYEGKFYIFQCNEPMETWMVGHFSGHAKYIEILPNRAYTDY